jgi:hypothetical protein
MKLSRVFVGAVIQCQNPHLADDTHFAAVLDALAAVCEPYSLASYFAVSTSGGFSRPKPLQDFRVIEKLWPRSTTGELHLSSADADPSNGSEASASIGLFRHPAPYERGSSENFLRWVALDRAVTERDVGPFLSGLKSMFVQLHAPSAYIHASTDRSLVQSELGYQPISTHRPPPARRLDGSVDAQAAQEWLNWKHSEDTNDRVSQLAQVRSLVGPRLRGTYWGTFLGREMVEELGGAERIMREAPVHSVESFGDSALYLQLTREPEPITTPAMQTGLIALEQFLQPVLVPLPPYWATRAGNA